jgi:carboxypeptidase Q
MFQIRKAGLLAAVLIACAGARAEPVDANTINRITDEGYNRGQVATLAAYLTDQIGGRMTNSPAMRKAEKWTQQTFSGWGLQNVHLEGYEFGRGWWIESASASMVVPRPLALAAIPVAWTPPTRGTLSAAIVVAPIRQDRPDQLPGRRQGRHHGTFQALRRTRTRQAVDLRPAALRSGAVIRAV